MTDQAVGVERPIAKVKATIAYLRLTTVIGTIISQIMLVPATHITAFAAGVTNGGR